MTNARPQNPLAKKKLCKNETSRPIKNASEISRSGQTFPRPTFSRYHSIPLLVKLITLRNEVKIYNF